MCACPSNAPRLIVPPAVFGVLTKFYGYAEGDKWGCNRRCLHRATLINRIPSETGDFLRDLGWLLPGTDICRELVFLLHLFDRQIVALSNFLIRSNLIVGRFY